MVILFDEEDSKWVLYPHSDAFMVTMLIANITNLRILIDNSSSAYILFWDAFIQIGIDSNRLCPTPMPLQGFSGDVVKFLGTITLSVLTGKAAKTTTTMANFLVVKASLSYNTILGHPTLNNMKVGNINLPPKD